MTEKAELDKLQALAHAALQQWGMDYPQLELIKHRENAVYSVTCKDGRRYAFRIHRHDYHSDDELRSELQWMQALDKYGIRTPPVIPPSNNILFVRQTTRAIPEGRQCDLLAWVDGGPLGSIEGAGEVNTDSLARSFRVIGRLMAGLHNQAESWARPAGFERHAWDVDGITGDDPFWGRFWELEALTPAQLDLIEASRELVRHRLQQFGQSPDRYGLIHADFLPENLLVNNDEIMLIDFDDAGFGWHLFDIATSVFFHVGEEPFDAILEALVEGYRSERELPDEHLECLPTFLMARGLTYLGWLHTRKETDTAQELTDVVVEGVCALAEDYCS